MQLAVNMTKNEKHQAMYEDDGGLTPVDYGSLRYVLYARKSTVDETRQVRSIPDQIADCEFLSARLGLNVVATLRETKSAKKPNKRPTFSMMLSDIRQGRYDGILAWHPDRLARNMREGGEVIDMIDEGFIKDLKFVTHHFTPDANGKMLLGMAFVLSKQYSDDLSQKVSRGIRRGFSEGKSSGTPKPGYIRADDGKYVPDGKNFELMCEAWQMRKRHRTYRDIATYMNENGYARIIKGVKAKRSGQKITMDWRRLTDIFTDPFYYGVLLQKGKTIDMRDVPGYGFLPAVSEEDWQAVQALSGSRRKTIRPNESKAFYPLRRMVLCSFCKEPMYVGKSKGSKGKHYLNYRCDNSKCTRVKRSIRGKVIFNYIYDFLKDGLQLTEADYTKYAKDLTGANERRRNALQVQLHSAQGALKAVARESDSISLKIIYYSEGSPIWEANNKRILELEAQKEDLETKIKRLKNDIAEVEGNNLSVSQFLNLSKLAGSKLEAANPIAKDRICRMLFLNLTVDEEKVVDLQIREPYATLLKTKKILNGRGDRT